MINPEARKRLADLMEQRRVSLRLTWREVAEAAGISYEALRNARNGTAAIAALTQAGIEDGLRWERGSIAHVLDGGDPVPAGELASPEPVTASGTLTIEPPAIIADAEDAEAVASAGIIALLRPHERRVWEQIHAHPEGTPAEVIFSDPLERALWRRTLAPEDQRVREIAAWRSVQVRPTRPARRAG